MQKSRAGAQQTEGMLRHEEAEGALWGSAGDDKQLRMRIIMMRTALASPAHANMATQGPGAPRSGARGC